MKPAVRPKQPQQPELPLNLHGVADLLACLALAVKQLQFYGTNNAAGQRAIDAARIVFQDVWAETDRLHIDVDQNSFAVEGHVVHEGGELSDSLPFLFYKDGIRELLFFPGFEGTELVRFMDVIRRARSVRSDDDDLVTLLWHEDLACLRYGYVDATADSDEDDATAAGPGGSVGTSDARAAATKSLIRPLSPQADAVEASRRTAYDDPPALTESAATRGLAGSDPSPLLLDRDEMANIQTDLERELGRDVVRDVVHALLDSLEDAPAAKQTEILGVFAGLVPAHLAEDRFELVAATLDDLRDCVDRGKIAPDQTKALQAVWHGPHMTAAVDALLVGLQTGAAMPRTSDVERVFAALGPVSFQRLVRSAESVKNKEFRTVLQGVVAGAMKTHRDVVYAALEAADVVVLRGVLQLLQQHPDPAHVQRVARLLEHDDAVVREAAMQVVVIGGGRDGIPALRRALGDTSSGVRTAALWGLGTWCAVEVRGELEARLQDRALADVPATEKMALFEAYARIGAHDAVPLLSRILLGRTGWRGRWPSDLRVCAARVLRLTQSPEARGHLEKACRDEDDGVRRAAQRALQRLEAGA